MYSKRCVFFFQAEDGIRDLVRSRGLGDVYKRQVLHHKLRQYYIEWPDSEQLKKPEFPRGNPTAMMLSLIHI